MKTSCITKRDRNEIDLPKIRIRTVEKVIMPRPPNWINVRIVSWPQMENCVPISITDNPVTQVADVAMNKASMGEICEPFLVGNRKSNNAPVRIRTKKLSTG